MKTLKLLSLAAITFFTLSCSKDDDTPVVPPGPANFSEIKMADIVAKEAQMATTAIVATNASGVQLVPGTVLVYKTTENIYGKLEFVSIDTSTSSYTLTLKVTNFNADGSIKNTNNSFVVNGTSLADLDLFTTGGDSPARDFHWNRQTATNTNFAPENTAKFYRYNF